MILIPWKQDKNDKREGKKGGGFRRIFDIELLSRPWMCRVKVQSREKQRGDDGIAYFRGLKRTNVFRMESTRFRPSSFYSAISKLV